MANLKFDREITALIVIDPYNDAIVTTNEVIEAISSLSTAGNSAEH